MWMPKLMLHARCALYVLQQAYAIRIIHIHDEVDIKEKVNYQFFCDTQLKIPKRVLKRLIETKYIYIDVHISIFGVANNKKGNENNLKTYIPYNDIPFQDLKTKTVSSVLALPHYMSLQ